LALLVVAVKLLDELLIVSCAFKSSRSLVVHFRAWCDTVQSQENHLVGLEQVYNSVNVVKHFDPYFLKLLGHDLRFEYD
jgi:hypothetical protein